MRRILTAALLMFMTVAAAAQTLEQKRKLYALGNAGPKYCPNIETGWFKMGAIGYDLSADDYALYKAAENAWFRTFRSAGSRALVCETLMMEFGPGTPTELFQFK